MHAEPHAETDEVLARQAQAGALLGFEELVYRYEKRIYRFVINSCRNESDAQEVTQETFVSAYLNIRQFDVARSFATWLFTIARHKCIDRHRANRAGIGEQTAELLDEEDPSKLLARREEGQDLWRLARCTLPELQFHALWLKYAEDMSVRDIARILRKTQTHVKVLLFRARTLLARELQRREAEGQTAICPETLTGAKSLLKARAPGVLAGLAGAAPSSEL
jgi:RNA polymerase sigma-70 factor (ECF subfamily)